MKLTQQWECCSSMCSALIPIDSHVLGSISVFMDSVQTLRPPPTVKKHAQQVDLWLQIAHSIWVYSKCVCVVCLYSCSSEWDHRISKCLAISGPDIKALEAEKTWKVTVYCNRYKVQVKLLSQVWWWMEKWKKRKSVLASVGRGAVIKAHSAVCPPSQTWYHRSNTTGMKKADHCQTMRRLHLTV